MLGELGIDKDPDCEGHGRGMRCAPKKITRNITSEDQIIIHEDYSPSNYLHIFALNLSSNHVKALKS